LPQGNASLLKNKWEYTASDTQMTPTTRREHPRILALPNLGISPGDAHDNDARCAQTLWYRYRLLDYIHLVTDVQHPDHITRQAESGGECCLLVLDSVTSTPQWIRQPKPRDCVHDVCVFVCKCVLGRSRGSQSLNILLCLF
jgi:hypothetical protein